MRRLEWVICTLALTLASGPARGDSHGLDLVALYEQVSPSVVTIRAGSIKVSREEGNVSTSVGVGSGVLLHEKGYIATAAHVVEQADGIVVDFGEGVEEAAEVVTLSRTEDLALLKVADVPKTAHPARLGDSDLLKVGEPVFSIGAPLALSNTLTSGIVSAIRPGGGLKPTKVIQTDAALNHGNSGGALFNGRGEVVGLASFIASVNEGSMGLGFAIPSNTVRRRLFENALPYVGVSLRFIPAEVAQVMNWPVESALLVERVKEGSVADRAGLKGGVVEAEVGGNAVLLGGDLIVGVDKYDTGHLDEIGAFLHGLKAGDTIHYTVLRGGRPAKVDLKLEQVPAVPPLPPLYDKAGKPQKEAKPLPAKLTSHKP